MNRLRINHTLAWVALSAGAVALTMFASSYESCQPPAVDTGRLSVDAATNDGKTNSTAPHCLVYGKYCLGDSLHGR